MGNRSTRDKQTIIDPSRWGVSFSLKQCRNFDIDPIKTLNFLLNDMGFRRFRLMSYWDEHERTPGKYDFKKLDKQIDQVTKAGGVITFCLGARQPRWPESHWPDWSMNLTETERYERLYDYIAIVVERYREQESIISWQLENEALNRGFGLRGDFNRRRLRHEFNLVKKLDPGRPIIMSTSNNWGIPIRRPWADQSAFSYYRVIFDSTLNRYSRAPNFNILHKVRSGLIRLLYGNKPFIHELQTEPWGPKNIWEMPPEEQAKSMSLKQITENIRLAKQTKLYPIDLWGGEWWHWCHIGKDDRVADTVKHEILTPESN